MLSCRVTRGRGQALEAIRYTGPLEEKSKRVVSHIDHTVLLHSNHTLYPFAARAPIWHRYARSIAIRKSWQRCVPDSTEGDSIQGTAKDFKEERLGTLFSKRHGCNGRSLLFFSFFQVRISIPRRRKLRHWVYVGCVDDTSAC